MKQIEQWQHCLKVQGEYVEEQVLLFAKSL